MLLCSLGLVLLCRLGIRVAFVAQSQRVQVLQVLDQIVAVGFIGIPLAEITGWCVFGMRRVFGQHNTSMCNTYRQLAM